MGLEQDWLGWDGIGWIGSDGAKAGWDEVGWSQVRKG